MKHVVLLLVVLSMFGLESSVQSQTLLQSLIDGTPTGGILTLPSDAIYPGGVIISRSIHIKSPKDREVIVRGRIVRVGAQVITSNFTPAITVLPNTDNVTLEGLDISATSTVGGIVIVGDKGPSQDTLEEVPNGFALIDSLIHGSPIHDSQRGLAANGANVSVIRSFIYEIHAVGFDTQAICAWNGPGPFIFLDSYFEASGENIMFGGSDPSIPGLVADTVEIRRSIFFKPLSWKVGDPSYAGIEWSVKNLFETKSVRRIILDGNVFENSWLQSQIGFAILLKSANQEGTCSWCVTELLTFTNNIIRNADHGIAILGHEPFGTALDTNHLNISNNLWIDIRGRLIEGMNGAFQIQFDHNTFSSMSDVSHTMSLYGRTSSNVTFTNNIFPHGVWGIKGDGTGEGQIALSTFLPGFTFSRNVLFGSKVNWDGSPFNWVPLYPSDDFYPDSGILGSDFRVNVPEFKGVATDGKDPGCDIDALLAAQSINPTPTPTPSPTPSPIPNPCKPNWKPWIKEKKCR